MRTDQAPSSHAEARGTGYAQPQLPPQQEPAAPLKSGIGPQAGSYAEPDRATAAITGTCRFTLVELQLEQKLPESADAKLVNFSKLVPQSKHLKSYIGMRLLTSDHTSNRSVILSSP